MRTAQAGFTLIEVLAALAVLAVALGATLAATANYGANAAHLQDRMLAGWVAHNEMVAVSQAREWPPIGRKNGRVDMARRTWFWEREVEKTPDEDIRRVTIRVRDNEAESGWLVVLKGFFAQPVDPKRQVVPIGNNAPGGSGESSSGGGSSG